MLTVNIHNDGTGTKEMGNYNYTVLVNQDIIAKGRVKDHPRKYSWKTLLLKIAIEAVYEQS